MKSTSNATKRNRIQSLDYVMLSNATVNDFPGKFIQVLTTVWIPFKFSSVEFTESEPVGGDFVEQDISIIMYGSDSTIDQEIQSMVGNEILLRLTYSNGDVKIVGTEENPVLLGCTSSGTPVKQTFSTKRKSAEKAKYLLA